jgi:hypothetical protein
MTEARKRELSAVIENMRAVSNQFYKGAQQCGNHAFIEFCGLMNEYIVACHNALERGIDFTMCNKHTGEDLPWAKHNAQYLGEKIGCIYGEMLKEPANMRSFIAAVQEGPG